MSGTKDQGGIDDQQKCPSSNYMKSGENYNNQVRAWQDRAGNHEIWSPKRDNRLYRRGIGSKGHFHEYNGETGREVKANSGETYGYNKGGVTRSTEGSLDDAVRKNSRKTINGDRSEDVGGGHYSNAGKGRITGSDKSVLSYATSTNRRLAAGAQQGSMGFGTSVSQSNGDEFSAGKGHTGVSSLTHYRAVEKDRTTMIGGNDNLEVKGDERKIVCKNYIIEASETIKMTAQQSINLIVGNFDLLIDTQSIAIRFQKNKNKSARVTQDHVHIRWDDKMFWVDETKTWYKPTPDEKMDDKDN